MTLLLSTNITSPPHKMSNYCPEESLPDPYLIYQDFYTSPALQSLPNLYLKTDAYEGEQYHNDRYQKQSRMEENHAEIEAYLNSKIPAYLPISPVSPVPPYNQLHHTQYSQSKLTIAEPVRRILKPKKPVKKEAKLELPITIESDNGKRRWILSRSIGKGGCGEVYLGKEILEIPTPDVAIKIVKDRKQFLAEVQTMKILNTHRLGRGFTPKLVTAIRKQKIIVMENLAEPLSAKFERSGYKFSVKTICMLALNMMTLIRDFNEKTMQAHVDIKPSNFCTDLSGRDLFLIDFGYATSPSTQLPGQTGTPLFMAVGLQVVGKAFPTVQDDYESLAYVLMFLVAGGKKGLPWGGLRTHKEIAQMKNDDSLLSYCDQLSGEYLLLKDTLLEFLRITRNRETCCGEPGYNKMYSLWVDCLSRGGWTNDRNYDWVDQQDSSSVTLLNSKRKVL